MSANITAGDLTVKAESVYAPLVPSAKVEKPVTGSIRLDYPGGKQMSVYPLRMKQGYWIGCRETPKAIKIPPFQRHHNQP